MAGEIRIGMAFGSYNKMTKDMESKYDTKSNANPHIKHLESESVYTDKKTKTISGNSYREELNFGFYGNPEYADAVIFTNGYQYGTSAKTEADLDKFDYIQGENEYAIDLNGNGTVDKNEVFKGKIDRDAYKQAKNIGDLNQYEKIHNQYNY